MSAAIRITELSAVAAGLTLYGSLLWFLNRRFRQQIKQLFDKQRFDGAALSDLKLRLDELNLDSAHFVFEAECGANVPFRDREITVAYGFVGTRAVGGIRGPVWTLKKAIYVLADNDQTEWMKSNPDAFTPALSGYSHSVYWLKLDALQERVAPA